MHTQSRYFSFPSSLQIIKSHGSDASRHSHPLGPLHKLAAVLARLILIALPTGCSQSVSTHICLEFTPVNSNHDACMPVPFTGRCWRPASGWRQPDELKHRFRARSSQSSALFVHHQCPPAARHHRWHVADECRSCKCWFGVPSRVRHVWPESG
jgi:hypothetical protein